MLSLICGITILFITLTSSHVALATITVIPNSLPKIMVNKGASITLHPILTTDKDVTISSSKITDLIEGNGTAVIPPNNSSLVPPNTTISKTELLQINYTLSVPENQPAGSYGGQIILKLTNGSITEIPLQITVSPDYSFVLVMIFLGSFFSTAWTALNDFRNAKNTSSAVAGAGAAVAGAAGAGVGAGAGAAVAGAAGDESKINNPAKSAILRGVVTCLGAILAGMLTFTQFVQSNPNFYEQVYGGAFLALAWGFGAHQILDNVIDEASNALTPKKT